MHKQPSDPRTSRLRDFQRLYLDADLNHSSGWLDGSDNSLEGVQRTKYRRVANALALRPGLSVLDVGCSWGALGRWLSSNHDADVVGLTLTREHVIGGGTHARFHPRLQAWETFRGEFDRVVCINALENFSERGLFFERLASWLNTDGLALIWVVTADAGLYRVPAIRQLLGWAGDAGLHVDRLSDGLGFHYAHTLDCWVARLEMAEIDPLNRWAIENCERRQRFYRTASALLRSGRNDMVEVLLRRSPG